MNNLALPCLATRFAPIVSAHAGGAFLTGTTGDALTLHDDGKIKVMWSVFDHIQLTARLVITGITPGAQQAENAHVAFKAGLAAGLSPIEAARIAKIQGAFSGAMRGNIVAMLDYIGAARLFGVSTCAELFAPSCPSIHFTSVLRHPVFVGSKNYNGTPDMLGTPVLKSMIETHLAEEARVLPQALWLPLGDKPAYALRHLASLGLLNPDRILEGMPHPSGANGERIACFLDRKAVRDLSAKTRAEPIFAARERLRAKLACLAPFNVGAQ